MTGRSDEEAMEGAARFRLEHAANIALVEQSIRNGVAILLHGMDVGAELRERAFAATDMGHLQSLLRDCAPSCKDTYPLGLLVDAAGFLATATGTQWGYLRPDDRAKNCLWAGQHAQLAIEHIESSAHEPRGLLAPR